MRPLRGLLLATALATSLATAQGAPPTNEPHIGYLYSAGGQRGTTVRIVAGGQNLRGVNRVFVSGEGVRAKVVKRAVAGRIMRPEQLRLLSKRMRELAAARRAAQAGRNQRRPQPPKQPAKQPPKQPSEDSAKKPDAGKKEEKKEEVTLPDHPLLRNLEDLSPRELRKVADVFFDPTRRLQASPQIAQAVEIEVVIDADAAPGYREVRLGTREGLSNPMRFQVGLLPEISEGEVNDFTPMALPALDSPRVLNGQIIVRDVDRFRFTARRGQKLVFAAQARRLVPYLADAVPGWFQATLTLYDAKGNEVGFVDDYRFDPDPVLLYEVPDDGEYELVIRDAIHRGREDFVYRITMGEVPFITGMFPLGGRAGAAATADVDGWNLPSDHVILDTGPGVVGIREAFCRHGDLLSNSVAYAVDDLPDWREEEPNDVAAEALRIDLPRIVNGGIEKPGDVDVFPFDGRAGDEVVAEVCGRRLGSPLDSLVELIDIDGRVLAWNDDHKDKAMGLVTHHADSYLRARLPADGVYGVRISDAQQRGGGECAYRLRIGPPRPDFEVIVTPSCLNIPAGSLVPVVVHVQRKDGFEGDIELELKNAPAGLVLSGGRIPAGRDRVRVTLQAPPKPTSKPLSLKVVGRARIGDKTVRRPAVAADDLMQAFLWRHLVPAADLLVMVTKPRARLPGMKLPDRRPVEIRAGGTGRVLLRSPGLPVRGNAQFELGDPPPGVVLRDVGASEEGLLLVFRADAEKAVVGHADNLIVEVYARYTPPKKEGKPAPQPRRVYVGVLPAIPFVITAE